MPPVHQIGKKRFIQTMDYPSTDFPIIDRGYTQEIEWPYRKGDSLVLRIPFARKALVVGKWVGTVDEQDALETAVGARWVGDHVA